MSQAPDTPQSSVETRLAEIQDIKEEAEKNKVELTLEVQRYIRTHLEAVQWKLARQEDVTEDDLEFIQKVRLWVGMAEEDRKNFQDIEGMKAHVEIKESIKRKISIKQWLDLIHVAEAVGKKREWIDETFRFPGGGRIETDRDLDLNSYTSLLFLPAGLKVNKNLVIGGSNNLTCLPTDLEVGQDLILSYYLQDQVKIDARRLKREGRIKGELEY